MKALQERLNYDKTFDCVQCGYCLPACPTYETMGKEAHSPRGRINLVKMLGEDKITIEEMREPIEKCLGCRACVTVCPTNVEYGKILEGAKEVLEENEQKSRKKKITENLIFKTIFPSKKWMDGVGDLSWLYRKTGLQGIAQKAGITKCMPLHLNQFEAVLPRLASPAERRQTKKEYRKLSQSGKVKVGFVYGCVMDSVFHQTNRNTLKLLKKAGADVVVPDAQTCCGALHAHAGKKADAIELAKRNIEAFEEEDVEYIVNNAGGCGAMLVEYHHLFEGDSEWEERAKRFVAKTRDISQVLVELDGLSFNRKVDATVTYQASCHLTHVQRVTDEPLQLLKQIPDIHYHEMNGYDRCCGSAGIYNIVHYDDAMDILDVKMKKAKETEAAIIVTTNPGCLLQMKLGIQREGLEGKVRAVHLIDLLAEAVG